MIACKLGDDVGVHRSPVPPLRHDRAEARTETAVCGDTRQQRPEFDRYARSTGVLEASLLQHVLEKCSDTIDTGAFIGIQRELPLTLKNKFPVLYDPVIEDHEGRDQRRLPILTEDSGRLQLDLHLLRIRHCGIGAVERSISE